MNKVLFLSYYFPPMGMGGTQRAAKFVKYLPEFGWEPWVVTVKDVHYYAHDPSLLQEVHDRQIFRTESWDPLRVMARIGRKGSKPEVTSSSSAPKKSRFLNWLNRTIGSWIFIPDSKILWLPFAVKTAFHLIRTKKIAVIFTTSPPHSAHLGGLILKMITGLPWLADFRDDWTGGESQPCPTWLHRFINRLMEKWVLRSADRIIGMCDHLTNSLRLKAGYSSKARFVTIMNGYDREDFVGLEQMRLNERFTICHSGSISRVSDPEPFLRAVKFALSQSPELHDQIKIQFFGTDLFGRLTQLTRTLGLDHIVTSARYLPHREALTAIMQSHLLLLTIIKRTKEEIITGKLFEYLASGKPILLISSEGEVANMIRSLHRGTVVHPDDISAIQQAILEYVDRWRRNSLEIAPAVSLPQFDRRNLTDRLAQIFSDLYR
ncbi:MAG: glycosyltransferase [candidate division KSB1 bacterium]|nr:glycosyltransferase [candidate division KSB1 bacterium]MDZ7356706.1 glycosyltransferase [candidate division KSB1 bacterium]MDZ7398616.1 glycosyltransferase [candidate division KSB1 bacterium]